MKRVLRTVVVAYLFAVGALAWSQASSTDATSLPFGSAVVSDVKGEVSVTLAGNSVSNTAQKGQVLGPNTTIECKKGSALLALADGSQVLLKPNTRVILRAPEQSKGSFLEELIGKITATVKKRSGNEQPFKMGTPTAVITVRGTKFVVEVSKRQQTFVQVMEGLVEVDGFGPMGHPVYLQPGYTTQVGANLSPENPRKLFEDSERGSNSSASRSRKESEGRTGKQSSGASGSGSEVDD
ncbi:hypothetical protein Acid345_0473 [Candidatus Koribacter versatilis Ellin345]|uniref:FecR protein domain-containing protein n=1 Tax=Koribacter versatilis (strain Ellin345) TaxID=204669 RepID=Q1IUH2_KORVE|nr:FecR family protein [Candidatus Koribacter versatilis]ABF39478.1 hypothetical protein Acid345_0473 [Candidatus Koribacter versatilis Ellin345]